MNFKPSRQQRGGMFLGVVIGLLLGLGAALAVALYVTKVPVPFINKAPPKSNSEQDAQEAQKNKNWDPNAPLYGKNPAKPSATGTVTSGTATTATTSNAGTSTKAAGTSATPATPASAPKTAASAAKPGSADPLGDLAKAKSNIAGGADPFTYFVQAGAYSAQEDAEAQRAKLSMAGFEAKITEREQSGRTVFRVRVGPLNLRDEADKTKEKLDGAGFETAIVRVQR
jgi:cell division protein FtsN